jgi:hypothetical protein
MSDYFRPATNSVARKAHQCVCCFYPIAIGETYTRQTGFFDGRAFTNKFHAECFEVLCTEGEGEFSPGSYDPPDRLLHPEDTNPAAQPATT